MTITLDHMAIIFLGWLQIIKSFALGIFFPQSSKIVMKVKKCPPCQLFYLKKCTHPAPLHLIIAVGPFSKWGIDFMHCKPTSFEGHGYIIVAIDYFTIWDEAMPTYSEDGNISALFLFNHVIDRFGVPQDIVTDHGSHFGN